MKLRLGLSVLVIFCLLSLHPALARIWTDSSGTHKAEAELVKLDGEVVHLKKPDGRITKISLNNLCEDDREFIRQQSVAKAETPSETPIGTAVGEVDYVRGVSSTQRHYIDRNLSEEQKSAVREMLFNVATGALRLLRGQSVPTKASDKPVPNKPKQQQYECTLTHKESEESFHARLSRCSKIT